MLQQTQVATVIPYYQKFTQQFHTIEQLAQANIDDVLSLWTGLGYYARARNLHKAATQIVADHHGEMPTSLNDLIALPGIGRSTAGAIMSLAHHQRYPILDGNVKRVLARFFAVEGWTGKKEIENQLWQYAEQLLPETRYANYIQAQMDLGATVCTRSKPKCDQCPLSQDCQAYNADQVSLYPTPKPKKTIPIRETCWLIAINERQEVMLEQRPQSGIWGGLWCFPQFSTAAKLAQTCHQFSLSAVNQQPHSLIKHSFTHFTLFISPYVVNCTQNTQVAENNQAAWYTIDAALTLGLPAPVKTVLKKLA